MPQPAVSNALRRANEFANVPTVMVFHTRVVEADLTKVGAAIAKDAFLNVKWFRKTSRAVH